MPLTPGSQLGPYTIVATLGRGGMGEVYRASDPRLGRDVAIKILPERLLQNPESLKRFEREARALAALNHPNIVTIHDVGTENDITFVVMELLEGETLRGLLSRSRLAWRKALDIGIPVADGLSAAHLKGVIHRDLKPENIFLTADDRVKILDFGVARWQEAASGESVTSSPTQTRTETGTVIGTIPYMSPEQIRGADVDARSDIFSFGSVLYEMLSGVPPFTQNSTAETMAAILKEDPPSLSGTEVPPELETVVTHCLDKSPDQRFQTARDLAYNMRQILPERLTSSKTTARRAAPSSEACTRFDRLPCVDRNPVLDF